MQDNGDLMIYDADLNQLWAASWQSNYNRSAQQGFAVVDQAMTPQSFFEMASIRFGGSGQNSRKNPSRRRKCQRKNITSTSRFGYYSAFQR
jgi:hypothetical protein